MNCHNQTHALVATTALLSIALSPCVAQTVTFVSDDFSSGSIASHNRFRPNQLDTWGGFSSTQWLIGTGDSGALTSAQTTSDRDSEGGMGRVMLVSDHTTDTSLTQVTVSFDYTVGAGSALYFHLWGLTQNGTPAPAEILANTGASNGSIQNQADAQYGDLSLHNGADPNGAAGSGVTFASGTSGSYSMTFDLTAYSWSADEAPGLSGNIANITDFDYLLTAFSTSVSNEDGSGAISIDNFNLSASSASGSSYELWAASAFNGAPDGTDTSESGDPDGDGYTNIEEWVLVLNPLTQDEPVLTTSQSEDGNLVVEYQQRNVGSPYIRAAWSESLLSSSWRYAGDGLTETLLETDGDIEVISATVPLDLSKKFIRLELWEAP